MKNHSRTLFAALAVFALLGACSKEQEAPLQEEPLTISATLSESLSKVTLTPGTEGGRPKLSLAWAEGDQLRVYDHSDHTRYQDFTLDAASVGQKQGNFVGYAFSAASYDVEVVNPSLNYTQQTQPADGETGDLKYIASAEGLDDYTSITFTSISSALLVNAKLPSSAVAAAVQSVELIASEAIFYDNGANEGKTLTISLTAPGDAGADAVLDLYAYLPVGSKAIPAGTTLFVRFNAPGTAHTVYTRYLELGTGLTLASGKLNSLKINCEHTDQYAGTDDAGTQTAPYLIADKYQMQALHDLLEAGAKKYFKLVDDIDLDGDAWAPVTGNTKYVSLDGNGKTLRSFTVTGTTDPTGLFSVLNGQVKDLTIDGATVNATTGAIGVLAGDLGSGGTENASVNNVTLTNCHVGSAGFNGVGGILAGNIRKADTAVSGVLITGSDVTSKNNYVGGLIGYVRMPATIEGCRVSGCAISGKDISGGLFGCLGASSNPATCTLCFVDNTTVYGSYRRVGGLAGWHPAGTISCCGVEADVTVSSPSYDVGGITGIQDTAASVENSYSRANASGSDNVGGLVGRLSGTVQNCYAGGTPSATSGTKTGGLVGVVNSGATVSKCISWLAGTALYGSNSGTVSDCYAKADAESGTVSSHAQESPRNWSADIWDFGTDYPTIKGTGSSSGGDPTPVYAYHLIPYPNSLTPGRGSPAVSMSLVSRI